MKEYQNYNIFYAQGDKSISDMDVCENLKLDPMLAGTPGINNAAINAMHKENVEGYMKKGHTAEEAKQKADFLAEGARARVKSVMKEQ